MNGIPAVSTDIQANVANIQAGLDKLSGLNFSADIAGKAAQFAAAVNGLIGSLKGMGGNFAPVGNEWASKIAQGFTAGISASTGTATAAVQSMISAVRNLCRRECWTISICRSNDWCWTRSRNV